MKNLSSSKYSFGIAMACIAFSLSYQPLAVAADEPPLESSATYKKLIIEDQSIDVTYSELPPTALSTDSSLTIKGGTSKMSCAKLMESALTEAGFVAEGIMKTGVGDFSCEAIFIGSGKNFDAYMQKVKDFKGSFFAKFLKGVGAVSKAATTIGGAAIGATTGSPASGVGLSSAEVSAPKPNEATAIAAEDSAKNGRLFGDDELGMVTKVCSKDVSHCTFVTAVLHKPEKDKTKEDQENMKEAIKKGFVLAANIK